MLAANECLSKKVAQNVLPYFLASEMSERNFKHLVLYLSITWCSLIPRIISRAYRGSPLSKERKPATVRTEKDSKAGNDSCCKRQGVMTQIFGVSIMTLSNKKRINVFISKHVSLFQAINETRNPSPAEYIDITDSL